MKQFFFLFCTTLVFTTLLTSCFDILPGTDIHSFVCTARDTLDEPIKGIQISVDCRNASSWDNPGEVFSKITTVTGEADFTFSDITESKVYIFTARDINPEEDGSYADCSDTLALYYEAGAQYTMNIPLRMVNVQ